MSRITHILPLLIALAPTKSIRPVPTGSAPGVDCGIERSEIGNGLRADGSAIEPEKTPRGVEVTRRSAIDEIVARARSTSIVILNEDHARSRDRVFAFQVARALRPLGYRTLAVETLANSADPSASARSMKAIEDRGYIETGDGTYTRDPAFAWFLTNAMRWGYRLVAYEATGPVLPDPEADIAAREAEQASNILASARPSPHRRTLIYVGFSHVAEKPLRTDGHERHWLAYRLKAASGIDPLTIDQTLSGAERAPDIERTRFGPRIARFPAQPYVLLKRGKPLVTGEYAGAVDLQVRFPEKGSIHGRNRWLLDQDRIVVNLPANSKPLPRWIVAMRSGWSRDAVPLDETLSLPGAATALAIPRGEPFFIATIPCRA